MNVGDVVRIKNSAGLLNVRIEKELSMRDVAMCLGDDKLPSLTKPRLEYHKGTGWGGHMITLCEDSDKSPYTMYLIHIDPCEDKPKCYQGVFHESEQDIFETVY